MQEKIKRATVGPLPGVTQDIAGFKVKYSSAALKLWCHSLKQSDFAILCMNSELSRLIDA